MDQDFDFVVDSLNDSIEVPDGWDVSYHKFGNPTFKKGDVEIDLFPISDHEHIKKNNLEPTIENFLAGVPFSIQALVFDVNSKKLIGKEGIRALEEKKFEVLNPETAREMAKRKALSLNEIMKKKADSMGFEIVPFDSK